MNGLTIIGIAVGLAMDALSVSVTNGFLIKRLKLSQAFKIAFFFGLFQGIMPIIGWAAGLSFRTIIENVDHWIAFGLLLFIGGKMIIESRKEEHECKSKNCTHFPTLLLLSVATSIDALAVGLSFAFLKVAVIMPAIIIGMITFILSFIGVYIGKKTGHLFENKLELVGGLILIGIGIKIVIEHIF